ncbi:F0F1 ATP synthase subunit epsilon [Candidatus Uabimicrobium sp. HlEnr_7]|uniref:F0F1 ATP synthase subunit epsilon n=1 Tax=Candidatus Uabimicrobium helgolandensis TaxID=3095367 RepID=UPI003555ED37
MSEKKIKFLITTPEGAAVTNEVNWCVLPVVDGEWAIKYDHAPVVLLLGQGTLRIKNDAWKYFHIKSGIAHVGNNEVNIICDSAIDATELSAEELEKQLSELLEQSPANAREKSKLHKSVTEIKSKLYTLKQMQQASA